MLVVGDVSYQQIDPTTKISAVEVVVTPENEKKLATMLGLKHDAHLKLGEYAKMYVKGEKRTPYIIINTDASIYLRLLLRQNMAMESLKIASPINNYVYMSSLPSHRFYHPKSWLKVTRQIRELEKLFYKHTLKEGKKEKLLKIANKISSIFPSMSYIDSRKQTKLGFEKYHKYALITGIGSSMISGYKEITLPMNDNYFNEGTFEKFSDIRKQNTVMEIIYLEMINNFLIPDQVISGVYPNLTQWKNLFIHALMDFITDEDNKYKSKLQDYALKNVDVLVNTYKPQVITSFLHAEKINRILPHTTWQNTFQK